MSGERGGMSVLEKRGVALVTVVLCACLVPSGIERIFLPLCVWLEWCGMSAECVTLSVWVCLHFDSAVMWASDLPLYGLFHCSLIVWR